MVEENTDTTPYRKVEIGLVLSSTMVIMTAMAVTQEREQGTMEALLVTPIQPLEMMLGKITPYILDGLHTIIPGYPFKAPPSSTASTSFPSACSIARET